jgi:hypothetical protein
MQFGKSLGKSLGRFKTLRKKAAFFQAAFFGKSWPNLGKSWPNHIETWYHVKKFGKNPCSAKV